MKGRGGGYIDPAQLKQIDKTLTEIQGIVDSQQKMLKEQ